MTLFHPLHDFVPFDDPVVSESEEVVILRDERRQLRAAVSELRRRCETAERERDHAVRRAEQAEAAAAAARRRWRKPNPPTPKEGNGQ